MLSLIHSLVLFCFLSSNVVNGAVIPSPRFVKFDLEETATSPELIKRGGSDKTVLTDKLSYYMTTVKVGSNQQAIQLLVDTGSSDMYVTQSSFAQGKSTTFKNLNQKFTEYYGSGTASGTWAKDTVNVAGVSVANQQFAIATTSPSSFGVFGIGYSPDVIPQSPSYQNFPKALKATGKINKVAFSFYAGKYGSNNGHLLFGGVDMAKVSGSLTKIAMINTDPSKYTSAHTPTLKFQGVNIDSSYSGVKPKILTTKNVNMLVDTGTSMTLIPTEAFNNLITSFNAKQQNGRYYIDCGLLNQDIKLNWNLAGVRIKSPLRDMVYQESSTQCFLGLQGSDSMFIFGVNALRAAYVVFDYDDHVFYFGTANQNPTSENIKVITNTVPTS